MNNIYTNQARNVPPSRGKMAVGQQINTDKGIGTITDINGGLATIMVPADPPYIFTMPINVVLFISGMNGEVSVSGQFDFNQ